MIGDEVTVTILGLKGNQVRIGFQAQKDVAVHREEIYERLQQDHARQIQPHSQRGRELSAVAGE